MEGTISIRVAAGIPKFLRLTWQYTVSISVYRQPSEKISAERPQASEACTSGAQQRGMRSVGPSVGRGSAPQKNVLDRNQLDVLVNMTINPVLHG